MNSIETLFTTSQTENHDAMVFINEAANDSVKEAIRLMSDNPTSSFKKIVTIKGHGSHVFIGYKFGRNWLMVAVVEQVKDNMNMIELEKNVDTNEYASA